MPQPRTPCLNRFDVEDLLTERAAPETRQRHEEHLAECPRCRQELLEQREFEAVRRGYRTPPPKPVLHDYEIHEHLGSGGFGHVWRAWYRPVEQSRAVKVLRPDRLTAELVTLLRQEARHMAALPLHPNRVQVFDLLEQDGITALVMAYVAGGSLSRGMPLPWERALRYVADAAAGLAGVHAAVRLHRDVKPANLLLDAAQDQALLADYGLTALVDQQQVRGWTRGYAAPEVLRNRATAKSDVFALAATLYALLVGKSPSTQLDDEAPLAAMPAGVAAVIRAGLEADEARRPGLEEFHYLLRHAHVHELAEALRRLARQSCSVRLEVTVSTAGPDKVFRHRLTCFNQDSLTRQPMVDAQTSDLLRFEVTADRDGYLTLLGFTAGGEVQVLFPNPQKRDQRLTSGQPQRLTIRLTPPAGTDHYALLWTPGPNTVAATEWAGRIAAGRLTERDRGEFVLLETAQERASDWAAVMVQAEHRPPRDGFVPVQG